jgi:hypothetical protein
MRFPRARFAAVFTILVVSTLSARADNTIGKAALPNARTEYLISASANLRFGRVAIGRRNIRTVTITNSGASSITLLQAITKGADFTLSGLDLPLTLAGGESFTFSGVFAPRSLGDASGSVSFVSYASSSANPLLRVVMTGTGTDAGQLIVDPPIMDFGTVAVGSSAHETGKVTALYEPVTISSVNISDPQFTLDGLLLPITIPAGGSKEYTVTFTPQEGGAVSANLAFMSDGEGSLAVQLLTGVGAVSSTHSVDLSWNASIPQDVIGYNVYRGNTSGGPYQKINQVLDPSTLYTDTSVIDGDTYYYVTTAVNSNDQESIYSNEAQATIPSDGSRNVGSKPRPAISRGTVLRVSRSRQH